MAPGHHRRYVLAYGTVEFVYLCIIGVVRKAQNDWHDVWRPLVAMHRTIATLLCVTNKFTTDDSECAILPAAGRRG